MAKVGRNDPCPCGSDKKYKKCCLPLHEESRAKQREAVSLSPGFTDLDELSNSAVDLIEAGRLDEAEAACRELLTRYPDQIDGTERLAAVYEAKGEKKQPPSIIARRHSLPRAARASIKSSSTGTHPRLRSWKPTTEGWGNYIHHPPLRRESHQPNTLNITRLATQLLV